MFNLGGFWGTRGVVAPNEGEVVWEVAELRGLGAGYQDPTIIKYSVPEGIKPGS